MFVKDIQMICHLCMAEYSIKFYQQIIIFFTIYKFNPFPLRLAYFVHSISNVGINVYIGKKIRMQKKITFFDQVDIVVRVIRMDEAFIIGCFIIYAMDIRDEQTIY